MHVKWMSAAVLWIALVARLVLAPFPVAAQDIGYLGTNRLQFEQVGHRFADATGKGIIDYRGGDEPSSQWRASFRFSGLEPGASYTVVIRGRFGAAGSDDAAAFTPLCSFETDTEGNGNCFWYFQGLARLKMVRLLSGDENGRRVLQATRSKKIGSITTESSRFSPEGEIPAPQEAKRGNSSR
jgi:hypothetical protein